MKKKPTAEYAETAEVFLGKDKKHKLFFGYGLLFAFQSSGIEDKRVSEEEAESAEIAPLQSIGRIDLRGGRKRGPLFPLHPVTRHLAISTSAFSATSAVKFFLYSVAGRAKLFYFGDIIPINLKRVGHIIESARQK